jgi:hypothetical protein
MPASRGCGSAREHRDRQRKQRLELMLGFPAGMVATWLQA